MKAKGFSSYDIYNVEEKINFWLDLYKNKIISVSISQHGREINVLVLYEED